MKVPYFYITTPIYYVNAKPHLGTLYSTIIADVLARWHKILGEKVFFLTGTDEHGQKIQERAAQEGLEPQKFVDSMIPPFKQEWARYNIQYDKFIRTTDDYHKQAVEKWVKQLTAQGDIYKSVYEGWYCVPDETFVTVGVDTPKDAAGGYLCPNCMRGLRELAEESYFFKLSAYQDRLLEFYEKHPDFIMPKERFQEVISFVKSGLKDLSISRKTVKWGIPFPGDPSHTVYVWGDALNNYVSAVGYGQDSPEAQEMLKIWWPASVQVIGKDIVRFHAVYWPAFLMAAGLAMPKRLLVHGYILVENEKMSKSKGNAVDPAELAQTYGVDQVRYYLMRQLSIAQDGSFGYRDLAEHINADLANSLGNLLNRTSMLAHKFNLKTVKPAEVWEARSALLREKGQETFRSYEESLNNGMIHLALTDLWRFIADVNAYFHAMEPWKVGATNKELFEEIISATCHALWIIGVMAWPVMPVKMEELLRGIGMPLKLGAAYEAELRKPVWNKTFELSTSVPLFTRIEMEEKLPVDAAKKVGVEEQQAPQLTIEEFAKVELLAGTITACDPVPGSSKLYRLQVDFGAHGARQILSGVAEWFKVEDLVEKQAVFVANLKPRKMMGFDSNGMLLTVKDGATMRLISPAGLVKNGLRLS